MLRRVLKVRTALPLLLCLAMAALWVRSAWREDWVVIRAGQWRLLLGSDQGVVGAGLRFRSNVDTDNRGVLLAIPHWFACLLLAAPAALALRKQRVARHICRTCGYDLRATPDRCPECGTTTLPRT